MTLRETDFDAFRAAFEATVRSLVSAADLERQLDTDGSLDPRELTFDLARAIAGGVWGQGFPEPRFFDTFEVVQQRVVGGSHTKLKLGRSGRAYDGMLFGECEPLPQRIEALYRVDLNEFNGTLALQLTLNHWRPV
jgi:single-stranded-DNA-specific exonuclease